MTAQPNPYDISPVLKMYTESVEIWRKSFDNFAKNATTMQNAYGNEAGQATHAAEGAASAMDAAMLNWQKSNEELFKRFVENQIEICRFFGTRWQQYLKLPDQVSHCRSVTELGNVQAQFLSQFANDYMRESEKLAQPVADMMSNMANAKAA
jgi:hypothetical protein